MKPSLQDWADAIGRVIFSEKEAGQVVYLALDAEEIGKIGLKFASDPDKALELFRDAVTNEVRFGWPNPSLPLSEGGFPRYLPVLVAQVVAAFQMHDDGLTGAKAYWRRLREFLGQSSEDKLPDGLKGSQHKALWKGLRRWANKTNGGRLGRVRLVEKDRGHHLVAEPLGQCLLRRADLEKIRLLFAEYGGPDSAPVHGRAFLRELVDDARRRLPGKYFTKHGLRVLDDSDRLDDARKQIEAEYERFLAEQGLGPGPGKVPGGGIRPPRTVARVLLQLGRRGLTGGLYKQVDDLRTPVIADVGEVLRSCYLRVGREGSTPPYKPPHDDRLLAARGEAFGAFAERSRCRAGDDVLLLIPKWSGQAWLDDADSRLFADTPRRYRSPLEGSLPEWSPLEGLPKDWLALRFKTREDLSGVTLDGKWIGVVDRRTTGLRAVGGLILRRGVWMLGTGPTVQVVGPGDFDHILVNDEPYPLGDSRSATPDLKVGEHRISLPGSDSGELRLRVRAPRCKAPGDLVGWHRVPRGWPASTAERRRIEGVSASDSLLGARLDGDWPAYHEPEAAPVRLAVPTQDESIPDELSAMILAVSLRSGRRALLPNRQLVSVKQTANPLLHAMLRTSGFKARSGADKV